MSCPMLEGPQKFLDLLPCGGQVSNKIDSFRTCYNKASVAKIISTLWLGFVCPCQGLEDLVETPGRWKVG